MMAPDNATNHHTCLIMVDGARYQAMRGVAFLTAITFVAEIGDVRRFETPRQLMAYLGLVRSERSTGEMVRRCRSHPMVARPHDAFPPPMIDARFPSIM